MTAFNVVRFKVKPGREIDFVDAHRRFRPAFKGYLDGNLIRTGEQTFCFVGEWRAFTNIEAARPEMIALLDQVRDMLEDLGNELGVTDPVSGEVVAKLQPTARKAAKAKKVAPRKATGRKAAATKGTATGKGGSAKRKPARKR